MLTAIEFFAGSGLVRSGLHPDFRTIWANDNSPKKRDTYIANHGDQNFVLGSIELIAGQDIPNADLAWASFPCQDLSLAGNMGGMHAGTRSGLFWDWIRVLWEMREAGNTPPILAIENVVGFLHAGGGKHFSEAYKALRELGYRVGGLVINASYFVPQSRPRAFIVAIRDGVDTSGLTQRLPTAPFHPPALVKCVERIGDSDWVWWSIPVPNLKTQTVAEICERTEPCDPPTVTEHIISMLSTSNREKLLKLQNARGFFAGTGYRRTRPDQDGKGVQRLEIRFDGIAGCLRTPNGGSSRQTLVIVDNGAIRSRLLSVRECARLMGASETFQLPGSYNDGYRAMGDGVVVPVTRWLTRHLLHPLAMRVIGSHELTEKSGHIDLAHVANESIGRQESRA